MLLKFAKSKSSINYLFPILTGILFWIRWFYNPVIYPYYKGEPGNLLFQPVHKLLQPYETLQSIIALALIVALAYIIQQINNHYNFIRHRSFLPAIIFILIINGFTGMHSLHPVYFASIFILTALYRLFDAYERLKPYSAAFDTGFLLGLAGLFYFNAVFLLPAFILSLSIISHEKHWREFALLSLGLLLPFILAVSYGIITEHILEILKVFELNIVTSNNHFNNNIILYIWPGYLILLTILGSLKIITQYDHEKVNTRKIFTVFFLLFVNSVVILFVIPSASREMFIISAIPVTYLMSNFFIFIKSRLWGEFLFFLLITGVVALQILK